MSAGVIKDSIVHYDYSTWLLRKFEQTEISRILFKRCIIVYKMKAWFDHYAKLLNVEFEWPSNELPEVPPTAAPPRSVSATLISKTLQNDAARLLAHLTS